jgi:hypothetical protein
MLRKIPIAVLAALAAVLAFALPASATSAHFNRAEVTAVTASSVTVSFKESGLGNSLNSVTITLSGNAQCVNPGGNQPQAGNKQAESVSGVFSISNGQATGSLTMTAVLSPSCQPPMTVQWSDLVLTDATFSDSVSIPGTFQAGG